MAEPVVVAGGSVGAMVAAREAARLGAEVRLLVPGGRLGTGFDEMPAGPRSLRLGVRLLELTYGADPAATPPLEDYRPGPAGHAPYITLVRSYIEDLLDGQLWEAAVPRLARSGRVGPDIHMTADLTSLVELLDPAERRAVVAEAVAAEAALGPAGVLGDPRVDPWSLPFSTASVANHGATFHRLLVESIGAKAVDGGTAAVATALRRKSWLALFHPRTLAEAARGEPLGWRPHRPFHVDASGGCATAVGALRDLVLRDPRITVHDPGALRVADAARLHFDDGTGVPTDRAVLAVSPGELFAAAGVPFDGPRAEVELAWVEVDEADVGSTPSTVLLADPDLGAYRVSPGGHAVPGRALFVVELAHDAPTSAGAANDDSSVVRDALVAAGIVEADTAVDVVAHRRAPAGPAPTPAAVRAFDAARARLAEDAPGLRCIGGAAAFGADSLNEQIIAGLHAARLVAA